MIVEVGFVTGISAATTPIGSPIAQILVASSRHSTPKVVTSRSQSAIDKANSANEEAAQLLAEHKAQLADARRQASELIAEGKAAGDTVRREIEEKARVEAQGMVDRARAEIERERDAALDTLRKESVDLALAAAARLMQENLDQTKDRQMVERYLSELGSGSA